MKSKLFLSSCLILMMTLMGCSGTSTSPSQEKASSPASSETPKAATTSSPSASSETPKAVTPSASSSPVAANPTTPVSDNLKISSTGIGPAKLGMTLGQLKKVLGSKAEFTVKSPFIVDFDAIAVSQSGKVQYDILYPSGKPLADSDKITDLLTDNPDYRTDKGVGPGTPLKQASLAYGDATLSYNLANEGREYVSFANQAAKNISFRLGSAGDGSLAGIYPSTSSEYNQTKQYKETAVIRSVSVDCRGQSCGKL